MYFGLNVGYQYTDHKVVAMTAGDASNMDAAAKKLKCSRTSSTGSSEDLNNHHIFKINESASDHMLNMVPVSHTGPE